MTNNPVRESLTKQQSQRAVKTKHKLIIALSHTLYIIQPIEQQPEYDVVMPE